MEGMQEKVNAAAEDAKKIFDDAVAAVRDSFTKGVEAFKSDVITAKESVEDAAYEYDKEKSEKESARRKDFDIAVAALRESLEQCGETIKTDGAALLKSLRDIAEDAGIEIKEDGAIAEAYNAVKDSFDKGFESFTSDMTITKDVVEDVIEEKQAEKYARDLAKQEKFDEAVETIKETVEKEIKSN